MAESTSKQRKKSDFFFGPYQLIRTLGEGEFGKVKLGIHKESQLQVKNRILIQFLNYLKSTISVVF